MNQFRRLNPTYNWRRKSCLRLLFRIFARGWFRCTTLIYHRWKRTIRRRRHWCHSKCRIEANWSRCGTKRFFSRLVNEGRRLGRSRRQAHPGFEGPSSSRSHIHLLAKLLKNPSEDATQSICYSDGVRRCLLPLWVRKRNSTSTWAPSTEQDFFRREKAREHGWIAAE